MRLLPLLLLLGCPAATSDKPGSGLVDADGDGAAADDCDDADPSRFPLAEERCDELDNDCNGLVDDDPVDGIDAYADNDGDGVGGDDTVVCPGAEGTTSEGGDCDDEDVAISPGATEVCNGVDDDCDGTVDVGAADTTAYFPDDDGDGFGATEGTWSSCDPIDGYVEVGGDCDDADASANPGAEAEECTDPTDRNCDGSFGYADGDGDGVPACLDCDDADARVYAEAVELCDGVDNNCDGVTDTDALDAVASWPDADGDGYGDTDAGVVACDVASSWVTTDGDCDDTDGVVYPGADEADCTDPIDYNCDGSVAWADADADGWAACTECDDADAAVNPDATEVCNGSDDDCDGRTDGSDAVGVTTFYDDQDGDGYGDPGRGAIACDAPLGYVSDSTDCDDARARTNPGAYEYCNAVDDDCDGSLDEPDAVDALTWYADADTDHYGDAATSVIACDRPSGHTHDATDCDDTFDTSFPGAIETCNGRDDDCDGTADEADAVDAPTWYADVDADGYGDPASAVAACDTPVGHVADDTDCDDSRGATNPGAAEYCNSIDDNCTGSADEGAAADATNWYRDADGDSYGIATDTLARCVMPTGYALSATDCDDADATIQPGVDETCDGVDDDCDGAVDEASAIDAPTWYLDADLDGYGSASSPSVQCDQPSGYVADATDCVDTSSFAFPGASETCNSVDDDCDGAVDDDPTDGTVYYADDDDDGFGDASVTTRDCAAPPHGYRADDGDCDDSDDTVHPYRLEDLTDLIDNDCDGLTDSDDTDTQNAGPTASSTASTVRPTGVSIPFCGRDYTTLYMISTGRVTFSSGDTDSTEDLSDFSADKAVAGSWDDLNPASGVGRTYWIEYPDAVGFYWKNVRETAASTTNTFSVVLFDDGRILLEYGAMAMTDGLAGFSCGTGTSALTDLSDDMAALDTEWGLGDGTDAMVVELFSGARTHDLDNQIIRLCGNSDGVANPCEGW